ncbi:MAG: ATP-binding protein, partial [Spirochaetaceae bacterium]
MSFIPRRIAGQIMAALRSNPVVYVNGPRQAGKSTLVRTLAQEEFPADYVTLDNATQMAAAASSPGTFLGARSRPVIIGEVQLVPDLFRVLKEIVDEKRFEDPRHGNGQFLLTGSADIMALPKLADALVGRMSVKTLLPFSATERDRDSRSFLNDLFAGRFVIDSTPRSSASPTKELEQAISRATFPPVAQAGDEARASWFEGYLSTIIHRDLRSLAEIEKLAVVPRLLHALASRAGSLLNDASIARDVGLNPVTSKNYRMLLNSLFLSFDVPPWYRNIGKRLVKSEKGYITDTMLLCHLLGRTLGELRGNRPDLYGHVVENFIATELKKQLSWAPGVPAQLLHFRTSDNREVDFVLERPDGSLAGIEVKTSDLVRSSDFSGLRALKELAPESFRCGVVLYSGD